MGCTASLVALMATMGGHWLVFQSIAWGTMIVNNAQHGSLNWAVSRTFDGKHPCAICVSIQEGRQQEQTANNKLPLVQPHEENTLMFDPASSILLLPSLVDREVVPFIPNWHTDFLESPLTPPPRMG